MNFIKNLLRPVYHETLALRHYGKNVKCPCCGHRFKNFKDSGHISQTNTLEIYFGACWKCDSYSRTRAFRLYLEHFLSHLDRPVRILHIAPEKSLCTFLMQHPMVDYVAGDKRSPGYKYPDFVIDIDINHIPFEDSSFDFIICSHVLEHVIDDRGAMRELFRVLRPDGHGIVQIPYDKDLEHSDEELPGENLTPEKRKLRFGQYDHVKTYTLPDFLSRMKEVGFEVDLFKYPDDQRRKYGINEEIMLVSKSRPPQDAN